MTYHRVCNKSNRAAVTSAAGNANLSGAPVLTPVFCMVREFRYILCKEEIERP